MYINVLYRSAKLIIHSFVFQVLQVQHCIELKLLALTISGEDCDLSSVGVNHCNLSQQTKMARGEFAALLAVACFAAVLCAVPSDAQTPTPTKPKNQTLGFCIWEDKKAYIYNVVASVGCIQRPDTYETATLVNGDVTLTQVGKMDYVEAYAAVDTQNTFSCSGYIGVIECTQRDGSPVPNVAAPNRTDLPPPVPTTRPINRTLGFCDWGYGVISVRNLKDEIKCVQRVDTFDIGAPINGTLVFQNAPLQVDYVEAYGAINTESVRSCSNYIGVVTCTAVGSPVVPVPSTTITPPRQTSAAAISSSASSSQSAAQPPPSQQASSAPAASRSSSPSNASTGVPRPPVATSDGAAGGDVEPTNTDSVSAQNSATSAGLSLAAVAAGMIVLAAMV
eukprot:Opistho-2@60580